MKLLIGTSKGLVVYAHAQSGWKIADTHFLGFPVSMVYSDPRSGRWWVGVSHKHWGQKLHYSDDQGNTWQQVPVPRFPKGAMFRENVPARLKKIWCMQHGGADKPERLLLGVEPAALFVSEDNGQTWELDKTLWNHPTRMDPNQWFGAGRDWPFLHSIVLDPRDSAHYYIAVSCAGVFETQDSGNSWNPRNQGLIAAYLPKSDVEVGHDPHLVLACEAHPDVLWQQNHCGVFRSENGGKEWQLVSVPEQQVDYGFALAINHADPNTAWVIPVTSDEMRIAPDLSLFVAQTTDGGKSWQAQREGLPQHHVFDIVFRHCFVRSHGVMAFGTTTGNLYLSEDDGKNWHTISQTLARIDVVQFAP